MYEADGLQGSAGRGHDENATGGAPLLGSDSARRRARPCSGHGDEPLGGMVGRSRPMLALARLVRRIAPLRLPVLVLGESGTGKELVASALHAASRRSCGPFVAINGATLTPELAASELFGHVRGAYTGASAGRLGAFRAAHGGTLFVDEVASLPAVVQASLLRVVEDGMVLPVGADAAVRVDVRVVAATCEPIGELARAGAFRADLLQRLAACLVRVPALRERPEDVPALVRHLLHGSGLDGATVGEGVLRALAAEHWSGNVRELHNVLVQAYLLSDSGEIGLEQVGAVLRENMLGLRRRLSVEEAKELLTGAAGNVSAAARRASVPRSTFRGLLRAADSAAGSRPASAEGMPAGRAGWAPRAAASGSGS